MPITRIKVENFRSVRSVTLVLGTHMILIGPNNAGKTAILDALHFALKGGQNRKRLTFRPSDIHLRSDEDDPKTVPGVSIEVHADVVEDEPWSKRLMADMKDVVQLGLASASRRISLRVRYGWNEADSEFEFVPEFLGADGNAISISRSMAFRYRQRFCRQFPVFYLSALRDVSHEFDNRSEFWHALLRAMEIPSELEVDVAVRLRKINDDLLESDKRLEAISQTLAEAARIASSKGSGDADLEIDGLNARELLARTGIRLRAVEQAPWIPIRGSRARACRVCRCSFSSRRLSIMFSQPFRLSLRNLFFSWRSRKRTCILRRRAAYGTTSRKRCQAES